MKKIFKFGGASVKNSDAIINLKKIVSNQKENLTAIVVSAIDKTTNKKLMGLLKSLELNEMKKTYIIFLHSMVASLALDSASAQLLTPKVDSLSAGKQATNKDTLPFTQVKTRHLFGVELAGAGGLASLNYSYFRNHVMYQIGLGVVPDFKLSGNPVLFSFFWMGCC